MPYCVHGLVLQAILLFASGIPTVESSWDKKYGGSESYWDYKERTSILIPMPPGEASLYFAFGFCLLLSTLYWYVKISKPSTAS